MKAYKRIKAYNPVKKTPKVPKKPVFPSRRQREKPAARGSVQATGGPWDGLYIPWPGSTLAFRLGEWHGRYAWDPRLGVSWCDA